MAFYYAKKQQDVRVMNKERYSDPTAEQAIAHVMRKQKKKLHYKEEIYKQTRNYENINKMYFDGAG